MFESFKNKTEGIKSSIFKIPENTKKYLLSIGMTTAMVLSMEAQKLHSTDFVNLEISESRNNLNNHLKLSENIVPETLESIGLFENSFNKLDSLIKNRVEENNGDDLFLKKDGTLLDYDKKEGDDYFSLGYTKLNEEDTIENIDNEETRVDTAEYILFSDLENNGDILLVETYARYGDSIITLSDYKSIKNSPEFEISRYTYYKTDKNIIKKSWGAKKDYTKLPNLTAEYKPESLEYKNILESMNSRVINLEQKLENILSK